MTWRGPASAVLSAILVLLSSPLSAYPVAGTILFPVVGVMLAVCVWFAYWGAVGALIGFALPIFWRLYVVVAGGGIVSVAPIAGSIFIAVAYVCVFVWLIRRWWIDPEDWSRANLAKLALAVLISLTVRHAVILPLVILPAINRSPMMANEFLWRTAVAFFEIVPTTLVVVFVLLLAAPLVRPLKIG